MNTIRMFLYVCTYLLLSRWLIFSLKHDRRQRTNHHKVIKLGNQKLLLHACLYFLGVQREISLTISGICYLRSFMTVKMHVLVWWLMTPRCSPTGGSEVLVGLAWSTQNPEDGPQCTALRHSREYHRIRHCGRNHGALTRTNPEIQVQAISVFLKVSPRRLIKMYRIARGFCCFRVDCNRPFLPVQKPNQLAPVCMSYLREYLRVGCIRRTSQCQHQQLIVNHLFYFSLLSILTPTFSSQQSEVTTATFSYKTHTTFTSLGCYYQH